jgi:hypothetical protein
LIRGTTTGSFFGSLDLIKKRLPARGRLTLSSARFLSNGPTAAFRRGHDPKGEPSGYFRRLPLL